MGSGGGGGGGDRNGELVTVKGLALDRYMGRWYEIAKIPTRFQPKAGINTRATYTLKPDGSVDVLNETWVNGKLNHISGVAWKADPKSEDAKFLVRFWVPPFLPVFPVTGDYWVMAIGDDYEWALVGQPSRSLLWVLGRKPELSDEIYSKLMELAKEQGYDISAVEKSKHDESSETAQGEERAPNKDSGFWWLKTLFGKY
ncbi:hypothetical protein SELMODRAFT_155397 [Selaginella moellendorffii]|uniref:Lipocalin/cytosolic fatty-acid binding domain-containing protein n=1 Tax=Selaginella moellendorffii TaxID=88036 RepID=D8SHJ4_SELML|nr:temperature-induced lipocalin-1 [Selaginella moellendorffii]EFJ16014.1 hypothetical protein SELMODRAFT_155397 [Selaginella moellendorffii]|eukprot:XP_002982769.1 temperature-induced lipocalin-1 [Selaginella moellendorffii]